MLVVLAEKIRSFVSNTDHGTRVIMTAAPQYLQGPPAPQQEVVLEPEDYMIYFVDHARGPIDRL
jgi:hypothetical protein